MYQHIINMCVCVCSIYVRFQSKAGTVSNSLTLFSHVVKTWLETMVRNAQGDSQADIISVTSSSDEQGPREPHEVFVEVNSNHFCVSFM